MEPTDAELASGEPAGRELRLADGLPNVFEMLTALAVRSGDEGMPQDEGTMVERIVVAFPMELEVDTDGGAVVRLGSAPPTQYTETTVMPVFHQLRLTFTRDPGA